MDDAVPPLTVREAAELIGVSTHMIQKFVRLHLLVPYVPGARPILFRPDDVTDCAFEWMSDGDHSRVDALWAYALTL